MKKVLKFLMVFLTYWSSMAAAVPTTDLGSIGDIKTPAQASEYMYRSSPKENLISVQLLGAVQKPGVYYVPTNTELLNDVSFRVSPLSLADAQEMVDEFKGSKLLKGYRGTEPVDIEAIARTLMDLASLSSDLGGDIRELDINPLIVYPQGKGIKVVDALICR